MESTTVHAGEAARFREVRETEFPWTDDVTYLNAASIGPLPQRTAAVLDAFTAKRQQPHSLPDRELLEILATARATVARLINAHPGEIALATNTSYGINQAAQALPLSAGDVVLVSEGEFPANVYPWLLLADRGIAVEFVPTTELGWPDEDRIVDRLADPRVRVLAVSFVQFASGYRADLDRLGDACRASDAFLVVDAIQGVGAVPLDVRRSPVDVLSCGAQKWLLSPWGSGFLYVRRQLVDALRPGFAGWMSFGRTDDFSSLTNYDPTLLADARRFEMVTLPFQDLIGMTESISLLLELEVDRITGHLRALCTPLLEAGERGALAVASPTDHRHDSGIVCVRPREPERAFAALKAGGVVAALREGAIRLSPHCYNTVDELAKVADMLSENG